MKAVNCDGESGEAPPLNWVDGLASTMLLFFVYIEARADNEQLDFQTRKQKWKEDKNASRRDEKEFVDGFNQSGLFALVRKPNYAAEQSIWISYYIFSLAATRDMGWNWSGGGFVSLCLLFQGSGWLTEKISTAKYPEYQAYQKRVPLYVPNLLRLFADDRKDK